ncbi:PREDICTED: uncharacterized protein LOC105312512 isoform X2 [Amphimedon queenslandica]|uniref:Cation-dependent mannose-6-phosphate receptor n=1 Tax=Amphimedon queenslandica TaxID=400682 RepID=A0A1X7V0U3_AMPQE|nr:PREDICTED: uncharacterized protein LOC105312512 isoform X2 [Amphimedon queenslandica]|eukprot:XP_011403526.1 PREDICTED: uncharacterized protein LOC105312512 isoform X2 [Amphimedon queenslandica]
MYAFSILFLFLGLTSAVTVTDCDIDPQNSCRVNCSGTIVDISDLVNYPYNISLSPSIPVGNYFLYNPCTGVKCETSDEYLSAVCLSDDDGSYSCGRLAESSATWEMTNTNPYKFTIHYEGGDCTGNDCKTSLFTFSETDSSAVSIKYKGLGNGDYQFEVTGKCIGQNGCDLTPSPRHANISGYIGFILIVLSLVALLVYFIAGILIMKFYKGATGRELIPNYAFWSGLPLLVKDGCLFTISPCCTKRKEYDSI